MRRHLNHIFMLGLLIAIPAIGNAAASTSERSVLIVVMDGLRPDYVTKDRMPNLEKLGRRGVVFEDHHSVFPTVTRVNASSITTGCYPAKHGLLGNTIYIPEVDPAHGIGTADAARMMKVQEVTGGKLLTAPTLGEILEAHGKKFLVVSAGSTGSSYLLNPKVAGGPIINTDMVLPESMAERVNAALGPPPPETMPNGARNARAVDAYLKFGLDEMHPDAAIIWFSDPDHTGHAKGIGDPATEESLRLVDGELGRIIKALDERGLLDKTDILVTSDHGFSTHTGESNLAKLLVDNKLKESPSSDDVILVEGAIYVKDHDKEKVRKIAELLEKTPWIGAIFVERPRPTHPEGFIPGTLSFNAAYWDHARRADLLVSANWTDAKNKHGWPGTTTQSGVAGHGTSSPFDIHNTLIAAGPSIKRGVRSKVPTANVDLAPTALSLLGIERPATMDGRVIKEGLKDGPDPKSVKVWTRTHRSETKDGSFKLELSESSVDGTDYLNFTKAERK